MFIQSGSMFIADENGEWQEVGQIRDAQITRKEEKRFEAMPFKGTITIRLHLDMYKVLMMMAVIYTHQYRN